MNLDCLVVNVPLFIHDKLPLCASDVLLSCYDNPVNEYFKKSRTLLNYSELLLFLQISHKRQQKGVLNSVSPGATLSVHLGRCCPVCFHRHSAKEPLLTSPRLKKFCLSSLVAFTICALYVAFNTNYLKLLVHIYIRNIPN